MDKRPVPVPEPEAAPYWAAARAHELKLPKCSTCGRYVFPPRPLCPSCLSDALEWTKVSGRGTVLTFSIMRDTLMTGFEPPYVIARIELEEQPGLAILTNIVECGVDEVFIGQPVEVIFEDRGPDVTVPQFRPRRGGP